MPARLPFGGLSSYLLMLYLSRTPSLLQASDGKRQPWSLASGTSHRNAILASRIFSLSDSDILVTKKNFEKNFIAEIHVLGSPDHTETIKKIDFFKISNVG